MRVYQCPQRDFELRTNDDETLNDDQRFCPTHYVPLVESTHPVGQCRESYTTHNNDQTWHCAHEDGAKAYEKAGAA